jgi:hypothetical protein
MEKKETKAAVFGLETGIITIFMNWVLLMIPSFLIQGILKLDVDDTEFMKIFCVFQLLMAFVAPMITIRSSIKKAVVENLPTTASIVSAIVTIAVVFGIELVIGTGAIVPFKSIVGFIAFAIVNLTSNIIFMKKYIENQQ